MRHELASGTLFAGDYRIVRPLSQGGMGAVYVAEQRSTQKLRALKVMHPELAADESWRRRFEQEARIGARIPSEHVVEVQAAGVDPATGAPYLVMELLEGEDLEGTLRRRGRLPPAEVRAVMEQICHAVGAAHAAGIVHRDLKPGNVFLAVARRTDAVFTVKVLDFGIAKLVSERTTETAAVGSPLWLAPEQTDRSAITPATDVWALGLIAYALLTGAPYWRGPRRPDSSLMQLMREVLFEPLSPASVRAAEVGAAVPPGFDAWFARAVARSPRDRFPDAAQAFATLAPLLGAAVAVSSPFAAASPPVAVGLAPAGAGASGYAMAATGATYGTGLDRSTGSPVGTSTGGTGAWGAARTRGAGGAFALGCAGTGALALAGALVLVVGVSAVALFALRGGSPAAGGVAGDEPAGAPDTAGDEADPDLDVPEDDAVETELERVLGGDRTRPTPPPSPASGAPGPGGATAPPATSVRPVTVSALIGGNDVAALPRNARSLVRSLEPRMAVCYRDHAGGDAAGGTLILWITIGADGTVRDVDSRIDTAPPGVGLCVLGLFRGLHFDAPPRGQVVGNLIARFETPD